MTNRSLPVDPPLARLSRAVAALAAAMMLSGAAHAATDSADAASAAVPASGPIAAGTQIPIKPGQSLNDIAIEVTASHDRNTVARAARALFDSNPSAFMSHDPSRLRLGSTLTVPALDATGAPVASSAAGGASAAAAGSSAAATTGANAAAAASAATTTAAAARIARFTSCSKNGNVWPTPPMAVMAPQTKPRTQG